MRVMVSTKKAKRFTIRATTDEAMGLFGFIRMRGKEGHTKVAGIGSRFSFNPERTEGFFDQQLVFYGYLKTLNENYRRKLPFLGGLGGYAVRPFNDRTSYPLEERESWIYQIPVEKMELTSEQKKLAEKLFCEAREKMPVWLQRMTEIKVDYDDPNFRKGGFEHGFLEYPIELREAALKNCAYFSLMAGSSLEEYEELNVPRAKIILTPMGGLPQWAKDLWKKR
ncbi:MAG: hypothetical protein ABIH50_05660 [bacterium]